MKVHGSRDWSAWSGRFSGKLLQSGGSSNRNPKNVRDLRGYGGPASQRLPEETPRRGFAIDPDRARYSWSVVELRHFA